MIYIRKSPTADTRTCDFKAVTKEQLANSSRQHIGDVRSAIIWFIRRLYSAGEIHDADKLTNIDQFYADFQTGFEQTTWWDRHRKINRHHLGDADGVPVDVNLIDVLEYIADCVVAGMARSGRVTPIEIDPDVLWRAFKHTAEMLEREVMVAP